LAQLLKWQVHQEQRLQLFLQQKLGADFSLKRVKRLIDFGRCKINGRIERFASSMVKPGDEVLFAFDGDESRVGQIPLQIPILYEDEEFLVCDKPPHHPTDSPKGVERWLGRNGSSLFPVHRLDRDTTGALIVAKNVRARDALMELFRERQIKKSYIAAVDGVPEQKRGVIENYLEGRYAKTVWEIQAAGHQIAFLRCQPETGRTHQIRLHLAGIGYPILGDAEYCRKFRSSYPTTRYLLHAHQLQFIHPFNKKELIIEVSLPKDMEILLKFIRY
jgi:RluA family pseudouridine synthase